MTKIDESKQYKFSEIIAMLENKELQENSVVEHGNKLLKVHKNGIGLGLKDVSNDRFIQATISVVDINAFWVIKMPKEDKFYLKLPFESLSPFLHYCYDHKKYEFFSEPLNSSCQWQFTQKEIDDMNFDTTFFEKVEVEDESND
ncbi:hypothetical protein [Carnobacterium maltaromaticum]|uniref:hypothetical protein n=1 Tax=Carnobacterium maltaromaticum TaxID=2751 RepID=UPI0012FA75FD|nr:hypothetical protein [Carnobacterium maltaromaticum]